MLIWARDCFRWTENVALNKKCNEVKRDETKKKLNLSNDECGSDTRLPDSLEGKLNSLNSTYQQKVEELRAQEEENQSLLEQIAVYKRENVDLKVKVESAESKYDYQQVIITELKRSHQDIYASTIWRVSEPLRFLGKQKDSLRILKNSLFRNIKNWRGLFAIFQGTMKIISNEGFSGVTSRANNILEYNEKFGDERYSNWIRMFDTIHDENRTSFEKEIERFKNKPLISVVMPVYNTSSDLLVRAINSVQKQLYSNWELCIADDLSTDPKVKKVLEQFEAEDERIKVVYRTSNGHISEATNSALELVTGKFVALLDHDDELSEHALFWVVDTINKHPDVEMIYSDEDKIDISHRRQEPYFKCDWNPDLFYSHNMFSHLGVFKSELLKKIGGFRKGFEGAQDYDLVLRCLESKPEPKVHHIPRVLYHWRVIPGSTALSVDEKPYAMRASERALNESLQRREIPAEATFIGYGYRVKYSVPEQNPLVSLIIPTRNGFNILQRCINSILEKTDYTNYEVIIVDNGSDDSEVLSYLESLERESRFTILHDDRPFNYSSLNNLAVKIAKGSIIGLLNNDVEVINSGWMTELVSHACRPEVGAVGAKLLYPDDSLQHGGVIIGIAECAAHSHRNTPKTNHGYCGRASLIQSFSAVTGACLFVKKDLYEEVGGLNEKELGIAFNDVDFCLKLKTRGYSNVWTPFAQLYHYESNTRGKDTTHAKYARLKKERAYIREKWKLFLDNDPAYSPNLTIDDEDFALAEYPRVKHVL